MGECLAWGGGGIYEKGSGIKAMEALRESRTKSRKKREGIMSISIYISTVFQ